MSNTITQAFVTQFDSNIRIQAQQKESRLMGSVTDRGEITGSSFTANRLAPVNDTPVNTTRHGDTQWDDIIHSTRSALMVDYFQALPVDRADRPKLLVNPNGVYTESLINGWNRRTDSIIYSALIGPSNAVNPDTGVVTPIALPASQIIANGGTGFTKAKIIAARTLFRKNEADEANGEELFMLYNSDALASVLADTQLTSADFLAGQMLQTGKLAGQWMGFTWIPYERFASPAGAGTKSAAAYTKSSLHWGKGFMEGRVQTRPDKKDTWQTSIAASAGATRVEEEKVVRIDFVAA